MESNEDFPVSSPAFPNFCFHSRAQRNYFRGFSDASSLPKNYCYQPHSTFLLPTSSLFSSAIKSKKLSKLDEFSPRNDSETSSNESSTSFKKLPVRRNQSFAGFFQKFPTIASVDDDSYNPHICSGLSDSSLDCAVNKIYESKVCYFNSKLEKPVINRTHSLIADDQIIDVEYDSDVGWKTTNVRDNIYNKNQAIKKSKENAINKQRLFSRDSLKLDLQKTEEDDNDSSFSSSKPEKNLKTKEKFEGAVTAPEINEKSQNLDSNSSGILQQKSSKGHESAVDQFEGHRANIDSNTSNKNSESELADDVFGSASKSLDKVEKLKPSKSMKKKSTKRSTSCDSRSQNSSVSINETPEYFDPNKALKSASPLTYANKRGSLKKSTTTRSDYDRDRGRSRHIDGGHRESFKKNERTNERGERDASDRDHKDGILNRSLSNTDTNLEDRIGLYRT